MLLALLLLLAGACQTEAESKSQSRPEPEIANLSRAIELALAATTDARKTGSKTRVTRVEQLVLHGTYIWRVTFKPLHLLPDNPGKELMGLGGEIFANVNLATEECTVGFGE